MNILRRTIHPETRVLDSKTGLVEYVASDESLDSYNEIVRADGTRFDRFQKNAPFVDSHCYDSIESLLGKVVDFRVRGRRVIETVQWAIDVPSNLLAQKGFEMTAAGYLKAVSIGFIPESYLSKWDSNQSEFLEQLKELEVPAGTDVRTIYTVWQQLELSACVIGANANAVALEKAYKDGILTDSDIDKFAPKSAEFARIFERIVHRKRSYFFSSNPQNTHEKNTSTNDFIKKFERAAGIEENAFKSLEIARRNGTASELERAVQKAFADVAREKASCFGNPIVRFLEANPEQRYLLNASARYLGGVGLKSGTPEHSALVAAIGGPLNEKTLADYSARERAASGISMQDQFGAGTLLAVPVAKEIYDLLLHYGAYKYLGLRKMIGQYMLFAKVTSYPTAIFITPSQQGDATIPADTALAGSAVSPTANSIASRIDVSRELIQDERIDLSELFLTKMVVGEAARIDWGCFSGTGADDTTNGMTTGIFVDPHITAVKSAPGAGTVAGLQRQDFINVIGAVNTAALQRMDEQPPRWYISPAFIPQLLQLWDGQAKNYLLKTPAETGGDWLLVGFPVTWATQAPSTNALGSKVAAFGNPDAYLVALHEFFEICNGEKGAAFGSNLASFRVIGRGQSLLREATGFATLQLA
jgi:HK97 family phage major capsid protein